MYIVNEIFTHIEIELMNSLYNHSNKYIGFIENANFLEGAQEKMILMSNIQNIIFEFEEFNQFINMKYSHYTLK